jgi:hypothetical protein
LRDYVIEQWEAKYEGVYADSKETDKKFFESEKNTAMMAKELNRNR